MPIRRIQHRLGRNWRLAQSFFGKHLYIVPDEGDWIFAWIARYIANNLGNNRIKAIIQRNTLGYRNQLIHFVDRYSCLSGQYRQLHPSNKLFMNWFHGKPDDLNPNIQKVLRIVPDAADFLEKIVVSTKASRCVLESVGVSPKKIVKIPLGIDLDRFKPYNTAIRSSIREQMGIPKEKFCIGCFQKDGVGWAEGNEPKYEKGPDIFLEAIARLAEKHADIFVILTGPARGYVKSGLNRIVVPYLHKYLENYYDIVDYYQVLDLIIIPSREEGGPMAFLEAWATGVPVVSTRTGMPADAIRTGENGILADIEDVSGIVEAVENLKADPEKRRSIVLTAIEDVREYDWKSIGGKYYELLYKEFLKK